MDVEWNKREARINVHSESHDKSRTYNISIVMLRAVPLH